MSFRYLIIIALAINQSARIVQFLAEIWILNCGFFRDIYFSAEYLFKCILKIEKIVGIIKEPDFALVEIDAKIDIACIVKAICEYRAENP